MALEFQTRDASYKGYGVLPSGMTVWRAKVFVDHLPPGLLTEPYDPYLFNDMYSHRPRYVIDANIIVNKDTFLLVGMRSKGTDSMNPEIMQLVRNSSIERGGLDLILVHRDCEYQGTLHPVPEVAAEAYPPHLARHRHRPP
jgi:hypothetical protein